MRLVLTALAFLTLGTASTARANDAAVADVRTAAKSFMAALFDGDVARAERLAYAGERERAVIETMALSLSSEAKLAGALDRQFGWCADGDPCVLANVVRLLSSADVRLNEHTAEIGRPGKATLPMRNTGDGWKVDVIELARRREPRADALARARERAAAMVRLVADVDAGKYASAAEALRAQGNGATASVE